MRGWLRCLALVWLALSGWACFAASALPESAPEMAMAWWRDPSGTATPADLPGQAFQPFQNSLTLGNSEAVVWVRLELPALGGPDGAWVLVLQPAMLQEVQFFAKTANGPWKATPLGLAHAFNHRPLAVLNAAYPLPASTTPQHIYIRIKTVTSAFQVQLMPAKQAHALDGAMHASIGLYSGITLAFTLLSLVSWLMTRDALWGWIGIFDGVSLILIMVQTGVLSRYFFPLAEGQMHHALVFILCTHFAATMPLSYSLARRFCSRRWVAWPYLLLMLLYPFELWEIWQGHEARVLTFHNTAALMMSLWGVVVSLFFDVEDWLLRWTCRALYWLLGGYILYYLIPVIFKIPPPTALHFYPAMPANFITMMFTAVMLIRSTQQARKARQDQRRRMLAERELELSRHQHEETSGLLGMLMHEIKNPLALIQTATRAITSGRAADAPGLQKMTQRIDDAVLNISNVLEHCIEVDRLEHDEGFTPWPQHVDVAFVLREWLGTRSAHARVQLDAPAHLPAHFDAQLWLAMVANLLQNAVKYSPVDSSIQFNLTQNSHRVELTVVNLAGDPGLPDPQQVFQKYYRSAHATRISGTGLGLYWVKVLSQRLGGDVEYLPPAAIPAPQCATFRLSLPAYAVATGAALPLAGLAPRPA